MVRRSFPAVVPQQCTDLPPELALRMLSSFLKRSEKKPYLHPDSVLTPGGVVYSRNGFGPKGGITMTHLRRVEAGMNGESMEPDPDLLLDFAAPKDAENDGRSTSRKRAMNELNHDGTPKRSALKKQKRDLDEDNQTNGHSSPLAGHGGDHDGSDNDYQDAQEYAQSQVMLEGEIGERQGAPALDQDLDAPPEIMQHGEVEDMPANPNTWRPSADDKAARRDAKKERSKQARREREQQRAG